MRNFQEYIDSGMLELYVLGVTTMEESKEVEEVIGQVAKVRVMIRRLPSSTQF